jgi:hypothetical protein
LRLIRYLVVGLIGAGILWAFHQQGLVSANMRPIAMVRQLSDTVRQASAQSVNANLAPGQHALFYTPETNPERVDVPLIEKVHSSKHVDCAFYSFTDKPTAEALLAAANRGVKIRIYRDLSQFEDEKSRNAYMMTMFAGNRNIQIRVKGSRSLMHLKAWSTEGLLRDGSSNLSASAKHQDNSITLSSDPAEIKEFEEKFQEMWERSDNIVVQ